MKSEDIQFNKYSRGKLKKENIFKKTQKQSNESNSRRIHREGMPRSPDRQEQGREDKGKGQGISPSQHSC